MAQLRNEPTQGRGVAGSRRARSSKLPGQGKPPPKVRKQAVEVTCPTCRGTGVKGARACPLCGDGKVGHKGSGKIGAVK